MTGLSKHFFLSGQFLRLSLFLGIASLGLLILILHFASWGHIAYYDGAKWGAAECTVKRLFVHSRPDYRGIVCYRPVVQIEYCVDDKNYLIQTYNLQTFTTDSGFVYNRGTAESLVREFTPNRKTTCWYLLDRPAVAVLVRSQDYWGWVFLVIPTTLLILGSIGIVFTIKNRSKSQEAIAQRQKKPESRYPTLPDSSAINESPGTELAFRLPVAVFPIFSFWVSLFLALLWNIVSWSILLYLLSTQKTIFQFLGALLFGAIFCGLGAVFVPWIVAIFRRALQVGNTIIEISDHPIIPGRKHRITLLQQGRLQVKSFVVSAICEEVARYRQGTNTITNSREVYRQNILTKNDFEIPVAEAFREELIVRLPMGAMHSMVTKHNEINWYLVLDISWDENRCCQRRCPIIVLPFTLRSDL